MGKVVLRHSVSTLCFLVALVLNVAWSYIGMHLGTLPSAQGVAIAVAVSCYCGYIVSAIPMIGFFERVRSMASTRGWQWFVALLMMFAATLATLSHYQTALPEVLFAVVSNFVIGFVCGINKAATYLPFMERASRPEFLCVMVATHLFVHACSVVLSFDYGATMVFTAFAIPVTMMLFVWAGERLGDSSAEQPARASAVGGRMAGSTMRLAVLVIAGSGVLTVGDCLLGTQSWMVGQPASEAIVAGGVPTIAGVAVCIALCLICAVVGGRLRLSARFQPFFLVALIAALVCLTELDTACGEEFCEAMRVLPVCFHALVWLALYDVVSMGGLPSLRAYGLFILFNHLFDLLYTVTSTSYASSVAFVTCLLAGSLGVALFVPCLKEDVRQSASSEVAAVDGRNDSVASGLWEPLNERCASLAKDYGLSDREQTMMALLAQGRTRKSISSATHLSEGTVKTHILHLYNKLGIHSQDELALLVYGTDDLAS